MKRRLFLVCILMFIAPVSATHADSGDDVQKAINEAKAAQKKADSLQGGWISTDKLIKQAEKAAATGEHDKALKLAGKAKKEAELAHAQADHERQHWRVPPYVN